jgi:hypothetical protein
MADEKALEGIARVVARRLTLIIRAVVHAAWLSPRLSGREEGKAATGQGRKPS